MSHNHSLACLCSHISEVVTFKSFHFQYMCIVCSIEIAATVGSEISVLLYFQIDWVGDWLKVMYSLHWFTPCSRFVQGVNTYLDSVGKIDFNENNKNIACIQIESTHVSQIQIIRILHYFGFIFHIYFIIRNVNQWKIRICSSVMVWWWWEWFSLFSGVAYGNNLSINCLKVIYKCSFTILVFVRRIKLPNDAYRLRYLTNTTNYLMYLIFIIQKKSYLKQNSIGKVKINKLPLATAIGHN